ncbi:tyrosine-type recombinase/integrase [Saccharopolyspora sp. CA-218241]|uniref:tyrosine-type recombinase/integrase n=1 Tax=Saccharopolyspora sp. CA-218241 TaxID=3240027 RepID=UPI003D96FC92
MPTSSSRLVPRELTPAPAEPPSIPPGPFGNLSSATAPEIVDLVRTQPVGSGTKPEQYVRSARMILDWLERFPGDTWQERWIASGLDEPGRPVRDLFTSDNERRNASTGLRTLLVMRVLRPSLPAFRSNTFGRYPEAFALAQRDGLLDEYFGRVAAVPVRRTHQRIALFDVTCLLTVQGVALCDITPEAVLHYALECRRLGLTMHNDHTRSRIPSQLAWEVLHEMGMFSHGTPPTLKAALLVGQRSTEELVDYYSIRNQAVRQLFIDYLDRRRASGCDYSTLRGLALSLVGLFWTKIEQINPGQADLRLDQDTYLRWRELIRLRENSDQERLDCDHILLAVRALYLDLQTWAVEEPERWAHWAVPSPIAPGELRGFAGRRRRQVERTADRIRSRQPLLPILVAEVERRYTRSRDLLAAAQEKETNELFEFDGSSYRRVDILKSKREYRDQAIEPVRVEDLATGKRIDLTAAEDLAFWDWAAVETLRLSGIRIEELTELTHLSIRQYERPNGEVIALLVIAPSKADRERVIPMSAELFHVIATIVRRHTRVNKTVPLTRRYDSHEKIWTAPMPFLFQRPYGSRLVVISGSTVHRRLKLICEDLSETHPAFARTNFSPHDFRRLFATDLVNNGLPIHIGAALLGHLNVQTTRTYVGVFEEDVVRHYHDFLQQRRTKRPVEEYRDVTSEEWAEFEQHFDKRKVELGSCARPYGTPCQHEHACLRCPMLHISPDMIPRLDELEEDLINRRTRAEQQGWLGEIEGLDLTLKFLRDKRDDTQRLAGITRTTDLGLPALRSPTTA